MPGCPTSWRDSHLPRWISSDRGATIAVLDIRVHLTTHWGPRAATVPNTVAGIALTSAIWSLLTGPRCTVRPAIATAP